MSLYSRGAAVAAHLSRCCSTKQQVPREQVIIGWVNKTGDTKNNKNEEPRQEYHKNMEIQENIRREKESKERLEEGINDRILAMKYWDIFQSLYFQNKL